MFLTETARRFPSLTPRFFAGKRSRPASKNLERVSQSFDENLLRLLQKEDRCYVCAPRESFSRSDLFSLPDQRKPDRICFLSPKRKIASPKMEHTIPLLNQLESFEKAKKQLAFWHKPSLPPKLSCIKRWERALRFYSVLKCSFLLLFFSEFWYSGSSLASKARSILQGFHHARAQGYTEEDV